jgi:hypothetical protein
MLFVLRLVEDPRQAVVAVDAAAVLRRTVAASGEADGLREGGRRSLTVATGLDQTEKKRATPPHGDVARLGKTRRWPANAGAPRVHAQIS